MFRMLMHTFSNVYVIEIARNLGISKSSSDIIIYYINKRQELNPTLNANLTSDKLSLYSVNFRPGQKFAQSWCGPNSMTRAHAPINIGKYGVGLHTLVDNSIDLQCYEANLEPFQ